MEMIFCTVTTNKYVFLAKVMAKSIKETNHNAKVVMCLVEEDLSYALPNFKTNYFDHIVLAKDIGLPNFYQHMFIHHPDMATVSFKGRLLQYAFNKYPDEDKFVYLDSDFRVYGPFEEIHSILDEHPIILTPHLVKQVGQDFEPYPIMLTQHEVNPEEMEFLSNKNGIYNSGMLALRRTDESIRFISWWISKIEHMSEVEDKSIIYGDQRWLDQAPVFFNAYILRHPGYNAAWWNHHERELSVSNDGNYTVNRLPLRCVHFSMTLHLRKKYAEFLKVRFTDPNDPIHHLLIQYMDDLIEAGQNFDDDEVPSTYSIYRRPFSKEWISMTSREIFRINQEKSKHIENPFLLSNAIFETWLMTGDGDDQQPGKTFTREDLDRIVGERLTRERAARGDYDDLKKVVDLVKEFGYQGSVADIKTQLRQEAEQRRKAAELESLKHEAAQTGSTPEILSEMKQIKPDMEALKQKEQQQQQEMEKKQKEQEAWNAQVQDFQEKHGDLDMEKLSKDKKFMKFLSKNLRFFFESNSKRD